jgi:hypothetical protein
MPISYHIFGPSCNFCHQLLEEILPLPDRCCNVYWKVTVSSCREKYLSDLAIVEE